MNFIEKYKIHIDKLNALKIDQIKLSKDLQIAYDYKEDLISKMQFADKQISEKQKEYHLMLMRIQTEISNLKIELDLHVSELNDL